MASFNGTISYEGSEPIQAHIDQAIRHAMDVRMLKSQAGLSRMTRSYDLPDGAQVYVLDYEHAWKVHIVPPTGYAVETFEPESEEIFPGDHMDIAGLVSGTTTSTIMEWVDPQWQFPDFPGAPDGEVASAKITQGLVPETAELFNKAEVGHKLSIPPWVGFYQLGDMQPRTQFHFIRPGNYTGAMAPLVQLLLGLGRQVSPDYEDRWVAADPDRRSKIPRENKMGWYDRESDEAAYYSPESEDYKPYPAVTQVRFDPRWNRTHGIIWADGQDNKKIPFIVEVARRGVSFMPVVLDEFSKTEKGRKQYEKVYPALTKYTPFKGGQETLFEAFGGFPTAENIPGDRESLDRAVRAGMVIRDEEGADPFYDGTSAMSTYFGWAFHPSAPRAMNVGWRWESGRKLGVCYEVRFSVSEKSDSQKVRNSVTGQVISALGLSSKVDKYKAERLPESFARQMVAAPDYDAFDEYEVQPDWEIRVSTHLVKSGFIDYPGRQCPGEAPDWMAVTPELAAPGAVPYTSMGWTTGALPWGSGGWDACSIIDSPQFKYYEPLLGEILNFDFSNVGADISSSDGPIFCTYTSKGAEILYYSYRRPNNSPGESYNTRQHCQFTGSWTEGTRSQSSNVRGYFYSTSKDFRKTVSYGSGYHKEVTMHRLGYSDFMSFCAFFAMHASLRRNYHAYTSWEQESWGGKSYGASVLCASDNRSAFLVCVESSKSGVTYNSTSSKSTIIGSSGHVSYGHIYHYIMHWNSFCIPPDYPEGLDISCRLTIHHHTVDRDSCFGTDPPGDPGYSTCPMNRHGANAYAPRMATFDGKSDDKMLGRLSGEYNIHMTEKPESWSESRGPYREFKWEVWGMGLDLMNARKLRTGEEIFEEDHDPQTAPIKASDTSWWRCSIPNECPMPPYWVSANYYGKPFVSTYQDIDMSGIKEFGAKPSVSFGPSTIPFGVVE